MQVSSRSWHMRLVRWLDDDYQPKNLCKHFWMILLHLALLPLLGILFLGIVGILSLFFVLIFPIYGHRASQKIGGEDVRPWWVRISKEPKPKKHRESNIFIEWVKAKKQRVCPLIEVVEVKESTTYSGNIN